MSHQPEAPDPDLPDPDLPEPDLPEPGVAELLALVEQLDADNERLRNKALDLARLMEDAVTAQVAGERRIDELAGRVSLLEAEIGALQNTRVLRVTQPLRTVYGRLRSRRGDGR